MLRDVLQNPERGRKAYKFRSKRAKHSGNRDNIIQRMSSRALYAFEEVKNEYFVSSIYLDK